MNKWMPPFLNEPPKNGKRSSRNQPTIRKSKRLHTTKKNRSHITKKNQPKKGITYSKCERKQEIQRKEWEKGCAEITIITVAGKILSISEIPSDIIRVHHLADEHQVDSHDVLCELSSSTDPVPTNSGIVYSITIPFSVPSTVPTTVPITCCEIDGVPYSSTVEVPPNGRIVYSTTIPFSVPSVVLYSTSVPVPWNSLQHYNAIQRTFYCLVLYYRSSAP